VRALAIKYCHKRSDLPRHLPRCLDGRVDLFDQYAVRTLAFLQLMANHLFRLNKPFDSSGKEGLMASSSQPSLASCRTGPQALRGRTTSYTRSQLSWKRSWGSISVKKFAIVTPASPEQSPQRGRLYQPTLVPSSSKSPPMNWMPLLNCHSTT
jgi:hypothetical protein